MFLQELYLLTKARNSVLNYLEPENTERNYTYVGEWMIDLFACGATRLFQSQGILHVSLTIIFQDREISMVNEHKYFYNHKT